MADPVAKINIYNGIYNMEIYEAEPGKLLIEWYEVGSDYCIGSIETDSTSFAEALQAMLSPVN